MWLLSLCTCSTDNRFPLPSSWRPCIAAPTHWPVLHIPLTLVGWPQALPSPTAQDSEAATRMREQMSLSVAVGGMANNNSGSTYETRQPTAQQEVSSPEVTRQPTMLNFSASLQQAMEERISEKSEESLYCWNETAEKVLLEHLMTCNWESYFKKYLENSSLYKYFIHQKRACFPADFHPHVLLPPHYSPSDFVPSQM